MHAGPQVPMNVFEPPSPPMSSSMPSESDFERLCRSSPVPIEILTMRTPEDHSFNLPSSTSYTLDPEPEPEYEEDTFSIIDPEAGFSPEEAFAAAQDGIHYATEKYPSENSSLSPAFRKEPVSLEKGDRVFVLDEVQLSPYLSGMRVKVERTAEVGLVPIWVVEGALERLARVNMAFNEAVSSGIQNIVNYVNLGSPRL